MNSLNLNPEVEAVFREFRTCELSTLAKDGTPITWPTMPFYQAEKDVSSSLPPSGYRKKHLISAVIQRSPCFSQPPTGCGLVDPPAVLAQGDANVPDEILTSFRGELAEVGRIAFERQPAGKLYSSNPMLRKLFDWYYMRLIIYVVPRRIIWWDHSDSSQPPHQIEVNHV